MSNFTMLKITYGPWSDTFGAGDSEAVLEWVNGYEPNHTSQNADEFAAVSMDIKAVMDEAARDGRATIHLFTRKLRFERIGTQDPPKTKGCPFPRFYVEMLEHTEDGDFDGNFEVEPVRVTDDGSEECAEIWDRVGYWAVFGHLEGGGVECLGDFATEDRAREFEAVLKAIWKAGNKAERVEVAEVAEITLGELKERIPKEIARINALAGTLDGWGGLIDTWEAHFGESYEHGTNVVYDIARVNIIHRHKGLAPLC